MNEPDSKLGHESNDVDEATFLSNYRHRDYPRPSVTVDLVIFTVVDAGLKVLLIKRLGHPSKGKWALPGGFLEVGDAVKNQGESIEKSAIRELSEECFGDPEGSSETAERLLKDRRIHLEQLYTFGTPYRDPRCRVVTVAHYALVPPDIVPLVKAGSDAEEVRWFSVAHELDWERLSMSQSNRSRAEGAHVIYFPAKIASSWGRRLGFEWARRMVAERRLASLSSFLSFFLSSQSCCIFSLGSFSQPASLADLNLSWNFSVFAFHSS